MIDRWGSTLNAPNYNHFHEGLPPDLRLPSGDRELNTRAIKVCVVGRKYESSVIFILSFWISLSYCFVMSYSRVSFLYHPSLSPGRHSFFYFLRLASAISTLYLCVVLLHRFLFSRASPFVCKHSSCPYESQIFLILFWCLWLPLDVQLFACCSTFFYILLLSTHPLSAVMVQRRRCYSV